MITVIIIILIIIVIKASTTPDKKDKQVIKNEINNLSNFSLQAKSISKFEEWNYSKECILDSFMYNNGAVRLVTKDGQILFIEDTYELYIDFLKEKIYLIEIL